jgi:hypothetical protein
MRRWVQKLGREENEGREAEKIKETIYIYIYIYNLDLAGRDRDSR